MSYSYVIPDGLPELYDAQWRLQKQQETARIEQWLNLIPMNGRSERFQKLSKFDGTKITARFGDTNPDEVPVEYRSLFINFSKSAKILDRRENMQLGAIASPVSQIQKLQFMASRRDLLSTVIAGALGNAYEGVHGETPVALPAGQVIAVNYVPSGTPANSNLSYDKLLEVQRLFLSANVGGQDADGNSNVVGVIGSKQWAALNRDEKFINSRYTSNRPVDSGMIKRFHDTTLVVVDDNLLPYNAGTDVRTCVFFDKDSLLVGVAENWFNKVEMLPTKNYDIQLYAEWGWGAARLYDEGVVSVLCDESP